MSIADFDRHPLTFGPSPVHPLERIERLEQLRPLAHGMRMGVAILDVIARSGIDTEQDLEQANSLWATFTSES